MAGIGYISAAHIGIDVSYNMGIGTIDKTAPEDKFYNTFTQIDIFYVFEGKKKKNK